MDDRALKEQLYDLCVVFAETRLNAIKIALNEAIESANGDTKSSAGDKHETGRAMAQLEQEKLSGQLREAEKLLVSIKSIERGEIFSDIRPGSLVFTDNGNYFIAISAGKIVINKEIFYAVSSASPIGAALINADVSKRSFSFNNLSYRIEKIL